MKSRSRKRGFTLVELLVVISIIALLLAIIIPSMNKARETAKRVICSNQQKEIARAISMYADAWDQKMPFYGGKDPSFADPYDCEETPGCADKDNCPGDEKHPYAVFRADKQEWWRNGNVEDPYPLKLGCLYAASIITDAKLFYCPSNKEGQYKFESYYNPKPWGRLPQVFNTENNMNQWVRVGYTYYPVDGTMPPSAMCFNGRMQGPKYTARRFDKLDPHIPYLADVMWYRATMSHKTKDSYAINAAFKDTHVVYVNDWRLFSDNEEADPLQLWPQWEARKLDFSYFYYNFLKKVQP